MNTKQKGHKKKGELELIPLWKAKASLVVWEREREREREREEEEEEVEEEEREKK